MIQKLVRIGNSYGIIIPREILEEVKITAGQHLHIDTLPSSSMITLQPENVQPEAKLGPEFKSWLDNVSKEYKREIKELANINR